MSKDLVNKVKQIMENEEPLEEMAKITGELETAIKSVIDANPDKDGLELKKTIKADEAVKAALGEDELYDNQLNKFIALQKGERTLQKRGRKEGSTETSIGKTVVKKFESGDTEYTEEEKQFIKDLAASVKKKPAAKPAAKKDEKKAEGDAGEVKENEEVAELNESKRMLKLAGLIKG